MISRIVNIGVLAHVDAGKTSLSERLLFEHGAIPELGSVDAGNTRTDSNELERERGITIRSAVVAFSLDDLQVNLVDTPGHPDFIAEVDRALMVLDGAILVVSAVEGVQAQTKVLMRSLQARKVPTLIFINKIDRLGARSEPLVEEISHKLDIPVVPMARALDEGSERATTETCSLDDKASLERLIEVLAELDLNILGRVVDGPPLSREEAVAAFTASVADCRVSPLYVGSALKGIGIALLAEGVRTLLPSQPIEPSPGEAEGRVFAIERTANGERLAYVRLNSGELRERDEVRIVQLDHNGRHRQFTGKITGIDVVGHDLPAHNKARGARVVLTAGEIGRLRGLSEIRVGARLGSSELSAEERHFPPPTLESEVRAMRPGAEQAIYSALLALSDEDPLIKVRLKRNGSASVLLYGEVQKEIIAERLMREFGVEPTFSETSPLFFERPAGQGAAEQEIDPLRSNDFWATIGLVLEPNSFGAGNSYHREVPWGQMPPGFYRAIEESALETLEQGLHGWPVTDCRIRLVKLGYDRPITVAADFRCLTPILVMRALQRARTQIYEPCQAFELETPDATLGDVLSFLSTHEAEIDATRPASKANWLVTGELPSRCVQDVAKALPGLTHGEAFFISYPGTDRVYRREIPERPRTDGNPLNYQEYMRYLSREGLMR
jgi:ribosomal protection tetracycline resistance protein